jgi:hypothetical protein
MIVNRARSSVLMTESFFRCFNDEEIECDKIIYIERNNIDNEDGKNMSHWMKNISKTRSHRGDWVLLYTETFSRKRLSIHKKDGYNIKNLPYF